MDPTRRTLMQVRLEDAAAANDLFATLMGDDVEPRGSSSKSMLSRSRTSTFEHRLTRLDHTGREPA